MINSLYFYDLLQNRQLESCVTSSFSYPVVYLFFLRVIISGETNEVMDQEKRRLLFQLQQKSSEVAQLEKKGGDLQSLTERGSQHHSLLLEEGRSCEREQLQVRSK